MARPDLIFQLLLLLGLIHVTCSSAKDNQHQYCPPSSCGNIPNISFPFWLNTNTHNCTGLPAYNLSCENNLAVLYLGSAKFYVQAIDYDNSTIRVVDAGIQKGNCSSTPQYYSLDHRYFHYPSPWTSPWPVVFISCGNPVNASDLSVGASASVFDLYVDASACVNASSFSTSYLPESEGSKRYYYVKIGFFAPWELKSSCRIELVSLFRFSREKNNKDISYLDVHRQLEYGVELTWKKADYFDIRFYLSIIGNALEGLAILWRAGVTVIGILSSIIFLAYKWQRRHLSMYNSIEEFLQNNNNLMPIRYSYSKIKKMTNDFKDKLGEGGFGEVYKAKLNSGRLGAVKLLGKSKSTGQDFVNEVGTIGRIHHINVVQLIGFCVEGSKRALVYDFMPNGSLDKYIFPQEGNASLGWESLYKIALGVAHGIEYLHQENNTVTLTAARGTLGYMAPELFYKNIGGISYKADVYSYGMLLMEIASKRKNLNPLAEHSSQIYFPSWVSQKMNSEMDLEIREITEDQKKMVKKMIIVALWCIQMRPIDRPSMHKVVEMLEAELESLQMPPTPFQFYSHEIQKDDATETTNITELSSSSCNDTEMESISLLENEH
ncbi:hypothetical protein SLE2022_150520 [Rubroshorea leprosula]